MWLSRGGFRPLQKVSANPYFNHTTFPPLFAFSALGVQGRAEGTRVDSDGSGASLGVCVTVSVPLQKVSANPYFIHTTFPPLISLRSRRSVAVLGLGEDGSSDTRGQSGQATAESRGVEGRAPKCPTNPVAVLDRRAPTSLTLAAHAAPSPSHQNHARLRGLAGKPR